MIVGRLLFLSLIQVTIILNQTAGEDLIGDQLTRKCAEINEYCQTHSDCCSNSCLTYLYRCARNYQIYPYPFLGITHNKTVTLDDILELNFGKVNEPPKIASRISTGNEITDEDIKIQKEIEVTDSPVTIKSLNEDSTCKENGAKCYRDHECCTNRCQHFLHQCVT